MSNLASHISLWREENVWKYRVGNLASSDILSGELNADSYVSALLKLLFLLSESGIQ